MPHRAAAFTYTAFAALCRHLRTMAVYTVADYLALSAPPALPFAILRLDVDYREPHAVHLAEIAARNGLRASFYFRWRGGQFPLEAMHAVQALGHEVGYHYEALDLCLGDWACARRLFLAHVAQLRAAGIRVRTVAAHGSAPLAPTYRRNADLLQRAPDVLRQAALEGDAMLHIDFARVWYVSDAGWRWRVYADYTPDAHGTLTSLRAWLSARLEHERGLYVNVHPHQWFAGTWQARYFRVRNRFGRALRGLYVCGHRALGAPPVRCGALRAALPRVSRADVA